MSARQTEINKIMKELVKLGWREEFGSKHRKIYHPKGGFVSMSISPSCPHAVNQIMRDINRLKIKHGEQKFGIREFV